MGELLETRHKEFFAYLDCGVPDGDGLLHWRGLPVGGGRRDHVEDRARNPGRMERDGKLKISRLVLKELARRKRKIRVSWRDLCGDAQGFNPGRVSSWFQGSGFIPPDVFAAVCAALDFAVTPAQLRKWSGEAGRERER